MPWVEGGAAQVSSHSSVVSNDAQMEEEEEEDEEDASQSVQPTQEVSSALVAPVAPVVEDEPEDIVLQGWGKPFHYLDLTKVHLDEAAPRASSSDVAGSETLFQDQEFDELVSRIFEDEIDFSGKLARVMS